MQLFRSLMVAIAAVEAKGAAASDFTLGSIKFAAATEVNLEDRIVIFHDVSITDVVFAGASQSSLDQAD